MRGGSVLRNVGATAVVAAAVGAALFGARAGGSGVTASASTTSFMAYGDALAPGWVNWSWDSSVNYGVSAPVYSGTKAISWTVKAAWGGLYLHSDTGVSSSPFANLSFALEATQAGQAVSVVLEDVHDNPLGPVVKLNSTYGGQPIAGSWKLYSIPLSALGGVNKTVGGIIIQDESGKAEPPMYVDQIALTAGSTPLLATATASAPPSATSSPTTTATAAPTKPPTATATAVATQPPTVTATPTHTPTPTPSPSPSPTPTPTPSPSPSPASGGYPWHTNIVSTTFWVGEIFNASLSDGSQVCSAYDSQWAMHWSGGINMGPSPDTGCTGSPVGGCDGVPSGTTLAMFTCQTEARSATNGYFPTHATPHENPFYLDLPFDDLNDPTAFAERCQVIPWATQLDPTGAHCSDGNFSYMKNHWVEIVGPNGHTCYGQIEDAGPSHGSLYHDATYVFGSTDARPVQGQFNDAGLDVSPALNGCLGYAELDGDNDHVDWQFIDAQNVPAGPWKTVVTTSPVTQ